MFSELTGNGGIRGVFLRHMGDEASIEGRLIPACAYVMYALSNKTYNFYSNNFCTLLDDKYLLVNDWDAAHESKLRSIHDSTFRPLWLFTIELFKIETFFFYSIHS